MQTKDYYCVICTRPVPDYTPEMCCDGKNCACMGGPIDDPICDECFANVMGLEEE